MAKLYHSRSVPTRTDRNRVKREFFRDSARVRLGCVASRRNPEKGFPAMELSLIVILVVVTALSARAHVPAGGPDDGAPTVSRGAGTAIAGMCLFAAAAIVGYGLWIIVA